MSIRYVFTRARRESANTGMDQRAVEIREASDVHVDAMH
jgi:hypothetical protein